MISLDRFGLEPEALDPEVERALSKRFPFFFNYYLTVSGFGFGLRSSPASSEDFPDLFLQMMGFFIIFSQVNRLKKFLFQNNIIMIKWRIFEMDLIIRSTTILNSQAW